MLLEASVGVAARKVRWKRALRVLETLGGSLESALLEKGIGASFSHCHSRTLQQLIRASHEPLVFHRASAKCHPPLPNSHPPRTNQAPIVVSTPCLPAFSQRSVFVPWPDAQARLTPPATCAALVLPRRGFPRGEEKTRPKSGGKSMKDGADLPPS